MTGSLSKKHNHNLHIRRSHAGVLPHTHIYIYPPQGGRAEYVFDMNWRLIN